MLSCFRLQPVHPSMSSIHVFVLGNNMKNNFLSVIEIERVVIFIVWLVARSKSRLSKSEVALEFLTGKVVKFPVTLQ